MVRVKMMPQNQTCIIDNARSYHFDMGGRFIKEDNLLPNYINNTLELPIISILSSNDYVEIGVFKPNMDNINYESLLDGMETAMKLQMKKGYIKMLRNNGKTKDGIRYNQIIYIYPEGTNLDTYTQGLIKTR